MILEAPKTTQSMSVEGKKLDNLKADDIHANENTLIVCEDFGFVLIT
jgi:hypothetical protein